MSTIQMSTNQLFKCQPINHSNVNKYQNLVKAQVEAQNQHEHDLIMFYNSKNQV